MTSEAASKEQVIRDLAAARRSGDFAAARDLIADDIAWHEPGDAVYSGDHRGADRVVSLWQQLAELTGNTFVVEPHEVLVSESHAAALTRWWAERDGVRVEGNEIAVYRFVDGKIAEVWFWYDGHDQQAHDAVFSMASRS